MDRALEPGRVLFGAVRKVESEAHGARLALSIKARPAQDCPTTTAPRVLADPAAAANHARVATAADRGWPMSLAQSPVLSARSSRLQDALSLNHDDGRTGTPPAQMLRDVKICCLHSQALRRRATRGSLRTHGPPARKERLSAIERRRDAQTRGGKAKSSARKTTYISANIAAKPRFGRLERPPKGTI
jgi:hypothetical protein